MNCPKCRNVVLKRPAPAAGDSGWSPGPVRCSRCGGYWFEAKVLSRIGGSWFEPAADADPGDSQASHGQDIAPAVCPHGHGILRRAPVMVDDFFLDRCSTCHGVWFDSGEWRRIAEQHLLESLPEIWSESWQRRQRSERSAVSHLLWAEEAFGSELFTRLSELADLLADHELRSEALAFLQLQSNVKQ